MWSGDVVNAQYYLPKGVGPEVLAYWYPPDGKGMVDNDLMVILKSAKNPVLAHLFLDFMLDEFYGVKNWTWVGYQVPFNAVDPDEIFDEGYPKLEGWFSWEYRGHWDNLKPTIVTQDDFEIGKRAIGLPVEVDSMYQNAFAEVKSG